MCIYLKKILSIQSNKVYNWRKYYQYKVIKYNVNKKIPKNIQLSIIHIKTIKCALKQELIIIYCLAFDVIFDAIFTSMWRLYNENMIWFWRKFYVFLTRKGRHSFMSEWRFWWKWCLFYTKYIAFLTEIILTKTYDVLFMRIWRLSDKIWRVLMKIMTSFWWKYNAISDKQLTLDAAASSTLICRRKFKLLKGDCIGSVGVGVSLVSKYEGDKNIMESYW